MEGARDGCEVEGAREGLLVVGTDTPAHSRYAASLHVVEPVEYHPGTAGSALYPNVPLTDGLVVDHPLQVDAADVRPPVQKFLVDTSPHSSSDIPANPLLMSVAHEPTSCCCVAAQRTGAAVGKSVPSGAAATLGDGVPMAAVHVSPLYPTTNAKVVVSDGVVGGLEDVHSVVDAERVVKDEVGYADDVLHR